MKIQYFPLCLSVLLPGQVVAACLNLTLQNVPSTAAFQGSSGQYAVYDTSEYIQTVNFRVVGEATGATCEYFMTLSAGQSGNFSQRKLTRDEQTLNYNVYTSADKNSILKDVPSATQNEVIAGSFPIAVALTQANEHSLYWTIDPQQIVPASLVNYQDGPLTLSLYSGLVLGIQMLEDSKTIAFRTRVESSVDLSLVDSGSPFNIGDTVQTIDFGRLETGAERAFDVVVRSNDGYRVTLQSENSQRLVHERAPAIAGTIDYTVIFDGGQVNLASGMAVEVASGTGTTPATGQGLPIEFSIGAVLGHEASGTYSDVVLVEVTAN